MNEYEALAKFFHDTYEQLAPSFGYKTRKASRKRWKDVPENNRNLMVAVAGGVYGFLGIVQLQTANADLAAELKAMTLFHEDAKKQIKTWTDRWNDLWEENRWRTTEDITDEEMEWDKVVEALPDGAKVPVFMTMAEIFLDEGSDITHWRPATLPEGE